MAGEPLSSNPPLDWKALENLYCDCTPKGSVHQDNCPLKGPYADEIERLTAELVSRAALREALKVTEDEVIELKAERDSWQLSANMFLAERDRLTATVEELRTVSAGLRAALERIANHRSSGRNPDVLPMHRIAQEALAGATDETSAGYRCPQCGGTGRAFHRYHGSKTPDACDNCARPISEHDRGNGFACPIQPSENGEVAR